MTQYVTNVSKSALYLGKDLQLTEHIFIHQPTVGDVFENDSNIYLLSTIYVLLLVI